MIIGIAGKAGAGKDTLAQHISDRYDMRWGAFADPIKDVLNDLFGWTEKQWMDREWKETIQEDWGFSPRQAAQRLGTEWRNSLDPTKMLWCKILERDIGDSRMVISDVRFEHEQDWIHSKGGLIVYIARGEIKMVSEHISENSINKSKIDIFINNNRSIKHMTDTYDYIMSTD